jgi:Ca2+-binding RTX toxin-like protein
MANLGSGVAVDGNLLNHADVNQYTVFLRVGEVYDFWAAGDDTPVPLLGTIPALDDPRLGIVGPGGAPSLNDDDSAEGLNAVLRFTAPQTGFYTVNVTESANTPGGTGGSYVFNFTNTSFEEDIGGHIFNPGGLPGTDAFLAQDDVVLSDIGRVGDVDVIAVTLTDETTYTFDLVGTGGGGGSLADGFLRLLNANGTEVASDDNTGPGNDARMTFTPSGTGTFFVVAQGVGAGTGSYQLYFQSALAVDVPGTTASTSNVGLGSPVQGEIEANGDRDWYAIRLVAGQQYQFDLDQLAGLPTNDVAALNDPELFLLDGSGSQVAFDDNSGGGSNAQIVYTPSISGLYFLDVHDHDTGTGAFQLSANLISTPPTPQHLLASNQNANYDQVIIGSDGNDSLTGGLGDDVLDGAAGINQLLGSAGNDTFNNVDGGDILSGGLGTDTVNSLIPYTLGNDLENLNLGAGTINGNGNAGANVIFGGTGINVIQGLAGNDTINGGLGNDTLIGGAGKDLNTGSGGLDHIKFNSISESTVAFAGRDAINTFAHGDKIDLSAIDANTTIAGNQAFTFLGAGELTGNAGQLEFDQIATNSFRVTADVNGDANPDFALNVYTAPGFGTMQAFDFIL